MRTVPLLEQIARTFRERAHLTQPGIAQASRGTTNARWFFCWRHRRGRARRWGHSSGKSAWFSMCPVDACWGHFSAKSFAISTNRSERSESAPSRAAAVAPNSLPSYREFSIIINDILPRSSMRAILPAPFPPCTPTVNTRACGERRFGSADFWQHLIMVMIRGRRRRGGA